MTYTSPWAGAHYRWIPPTDPQEERDRELALATYPRMEERDRNNKSREAGLAFMKGLEYDAEWVASRAFSLGIFRSSSSLLDGSQRTITLFPFRCSALIAS